MKLFVTLLLFTFSACYAASIRGYIKDKEFSKLRAKDRLVDSFQPKLQNLCTSGNTFKLGDDCEVSFAMKDLEPTSGKHVFKSHACGDEDTIIVTMNLNDKMPSHAARLNQGSMQWTELIAMPHLEEHGCIYTTIANIDVDPEKKTKRRFRGDAKKRSHGQRKLNSTSTIDADITPMQHADRQLQQACSEYKVIRLAVRYDSRFCAEVGNGTPEGAVAFGNTIIELMNPFFNVAPLCMKVELCSIEGSCSANADPYRNMLDNGNTVCDDNDSTALLDNFRGLFNPRPPQGCDSTHLFFGGDPYPTDAAGCAYLAALCDDYSVGVNSISNGFPLIEHVLLVTHELGHSLGAEHVLGEDQYIMSYGDRPDSFKQENINRMTSYVDEVKAQDSTCTARETAGPPTVAPTSAPCAGSEFRLVLQTDEYGEETSWDVTGSNGVTIAQGNGYGSNSKFEIDDCLPSGTDYTFTIRDTYDDGICCEYGAGNYELYVDGSLVYSSNGQFEGEEVVPLPGGNNNSPPTPAPTPNPTPVPTNAPTPGPTPNPTPAPIPNSTPPPTPNPTPGPSPGPTPAPTDEWGEELSWQVEDPSGNVVVQGDNYPSGENFIEVTECLQSDGVHIFRIMDSYGDGMCCGAYYKLWYDENLVIAHDGQYANGESVTVPGGQVNQAPSGSPNQAPVASPTVGSCNHEFRLQLQTDEWGEEVSWELEDPNGNIVVQGGDYPSGENFVDTTECLSSDGVHTFKIMDSYGDGMVGDAYYKLWYDGNVVIFHDGQYGYGESVSVPGGNVF
ncbi:unnamed protein product [Cylindrotheca closterium]|uniref:Peptidase M12B domain-containing protein n=1 Tax=Cylindrotheca closterium TaxID=2856 RepID=A0AAD2G6X1_9STRA|nr:unnamed protein product [Cylindrotheca closterium]